MIQSADPEGDWWLQAPVLVQDILACSLSPGQSAQYQLGEAILEVHSNHSRVLDLLHLHWGDCMAPVSWATRGMRIRCTVRAIEHPALALVSFQGSEEADGSPLGVERLQHLRMRRHVEIPSPVPGWRLTSFSAAPARPFMARCGYEALVDLRQEPLQHTPGFLYRYVVNAAIAAQKGTLFVHAASVGIGGTSVLLMGRAVSGKTTVAFALAARGHALLGEEVACIRLLSGELLPLRRTAGIRRGPRARAIAERLAARRWDTEVLQDGTERMLVRGSELFPDTVVLPTSLRCAFYLRGFAERAAVEAFIPSAQNRDLMWQLSQDPMVVIGVTPARRCMNLFRLLDLLASRRCYFLDVGPPEETAELIERIVEDEGVHYSGQRV